MAIKAINDLTEITKEDLTANDVLVVGTPGDAEEPVKKINAQEAFTGGGGGESPVEALEISVSGSTASTVKTAAEIEALYAAGKFLYSTTNIGAYAQLIYGLFLTPAQTGDGYVLYASAKGDSSTPMGITFTGSSATAPMTAQIG